MKAIDPRSDATLPRNATAAPVGTDVGVVEVPDGVEVLDAVEPFDVVVVADGLVVGVEDDAEELAVPEVDSVEPAVPEADPVDSEDPEVD